MKLSFFFKGFRECLTVFVNLEPLCSVTTKHQQGPVRILNRFFFFSKVFPHLTKENSRNLLIVPLLLGILAVEDYLKGSTYSPKLLIVREIFLMSLLNHETVYILVFIERIKMVIHYTLVGAGDVITVTTKQKNEH